MDPEATMAILLDGTSTNDEAREAAVNLLVWLAKGGAIEGSPDHRANVVRLCEVAILAEFDRLDP